MYYAITKDGIEFVGIFLSNPYPYNIQGVTIHEMDGHPPDLSIMEWSFDNDDFKERSGALTKLRFLNRFTPQERIAARTSADPMVQDILALTDIAEYVDTRDTNTIQSVQYLSSIGIIPPERVSIILA